MKSHQPGKKAMSWNRSVCAVIALLAGAAFVPSSAFAAKDVAEEAAFHPCMALMEPTLRMERKKAARIRIKDFDARILAFTNQLGRNPKMQATLECLMRQSD